MVIISTLLGVLVENHLASFTNVAWLDEGICNMSVENPVSVAKYILVAEGSFNANLGKFLL